MGAEDGENVISQELLVKSGERFRSSLHQCAAIINDVDYILIVAIADASRALLAGLLRLIESDLFLLQWNGLDWRPSLYAWKGNIENVPDRGKFA